MVFVTLMVMSLTEKATTVENLFAGAFRWTGDGEWMNMKGNGSGDAFPVSFPFINLFCVCKARNVRGILGNAFY